MQHKHSWVGSYVAIGFNAAVRGGNRAGWQAAIAYINIACYLHFWCSFGTKFGICTKLGCEGGIWMGMLTGTVVQTIILIWICVRTNWEKEASMAEERIRKWSGQKRIVEEQ
uniref:Multi antimicrobial extrusion protein n=1 Tax=Helianthus annuus TaxID=4232 RepID=A0A1Y3BXD6_HELAN